MTILDGKATAKSIRDRLSQQVHALQVRGDKPPHLAVILLGNDPASHTYVHNKIKACHEVGFQTTLIQRTDLPEASLLKLIEEINQDQTIDGLIVQLPLPQHISASKVIGAINPSKDVDGLHPLNYGRMARSLPAHIPATPLGILTLLAHYQIPIQGKHCVVVGRGIIVGTPLSMLLSRNADPGNATVTLCHSHTQDLGSHTRQADILVAAVGKPKLITAAMVQQGAVVIDVGTTRVPDLTSKIGYRLQGDVDFEQVAPRCSYITPVPGGIGPMTIAALLDNTLRAAQHTLYQACTITKQ